MTTTEDDSSKLVEMLKTNQLGLLKANHSFQKRSFHIVVPSKITKVYTDRFSNEKIQKR